MSRQDFRAALFISVIAAVLGSVLSFILALFQPEIRDSLIARFKVYTELTLPALNATTLPLESVDGACREYSNPTKNFFVQGDLLYNIENDSLVISAYFEVHETAINGCESIYRTELTGKALPVATQALGRGDLVLPNGGTKFRERLLFNNIQGPELDIRDDGRSFRFESGRASLKQGGGGLLIINIKPVTLQARQ